MGAKPAGWDEGVVTPNAPPGWDDAAPAKAPNERLIKKHLSAPLNDTPIPGAEIQQYPAGKKFALGVGAGMLRAGYGLRQIISGDEADAELGAKAREVREAATPLGGWGTAGRYFGEATPAFLPVGGKLATTVPRLMAQGAAGGGLSGFISPVEEGQSRTANTLVGAGAGAATAGIIGGAVKAATSEVRQPVADRLTQMGFKFPTGLKMAKREGLVDTVQRYGLTPDGDGYLKMRSLLDDLGGKQQALETNALANDIVSGRRVRSVDIAKWLDRVAAETSSSDLPVTAKRTVLDYRRQFLSEKKPYMTTQEVIQLKRNLQDQLNGVYRANDKVSSAVQEGWLTKSKEAVERASRDILEELIPGYGAINKEISHIKALEPLLETAVGRIHNANPVRLGDQTAGIIGADVGGLPGSAAMAAGSRIINTPTKWAQAGNALSKVKKGGPDFDMQALLAYRAPIMKALPAAPTKLPSGRPDPSGLLKQDDVIPAVSTDAYEQAWAQYATVPPRNVAGLRDLQDVVPKGRPPGGLIEGWNGPVSLKTGAPPRPGMLGGAGQEIGRFGVPQRSNMAPINDWSESVGGFPARLERTVPDAQLAPSPIKTGVKPPKVTDWAADAEKANVKFMGMQDIGGGKSVPVFQDGNNQSGVGSFVAQPGETVAQALARAKKRYKETK